VLVLALLVIGSQALAVEVKVANNAWDKMPLYFVEGYGPSAGKAAYQTLSGGQPTYFTATGVWLTQRSKSPKVETLSPVDGLQPAAYHPQSKPSWALKLEFLGAHETTPQALAPLEAKVNYFHGKPEQWRAGLTSYGELVYSGLWPGVDLHYRGDQGRLKSTFTVQPGADPRRIQLAWRGAEKVTVSDVGRLQIETPVGILEEEKPIAWQEREGQRIPVAVSYQAEADANGGWRHSFAVGSYDPTLLLVIDPVTLAYSGFIGGSGEENATGIAVDSAGAAYVTGYVDSSTAFPTTPGAIALVHPNDTNNTWLDSFVVKIKPDGSGLVYAGVFGGRELDKPSGIAVDGAGAVYISGTTRSSDFPIVGTLGAALHGDADVFVVKINPEGSKLVYAGLVGGSTIDWSTAIAVDGAGSAYLTGYTQSSDFPIVGGLGGNYHRDCDAFVLKVRADGSGLAYSGLLAGNNAEQGSGIAVDRDGAAYVTGYSLSTDFPIVGGLGVAPPDPYKSRPFVTKVRPDGSGLIYSTFLDAWGGSNAIAVDQAGYAYVTGIGYTSNFQIIKGFPPPSSSVGSFVVKLKPEGSQLAYARVLTGFGSFCNTWSCDFGGAVAIAIDSKGAAYVTGSTHYYESKLFPLIDWLGDIPKDFSGTGSVAFVAKLQPDGDKVAYSGVLGGINNADTQYLSFTTRATSIAVDTKGGVYITGATSAVDFPVVVGPGLSHHRNLDMFVAKIVEIATPTPPIAVIDSYKTYIKQRLIVEGPGVLRNDLSPGGESLTASVANAPTKGTLRLQADGGFSYEPASTGQSVVKKDRFDYIAHNSAGSSAPAAVTLEVSAPPEAHEDTYQVSGDRPWASSGSVFDNDSNIISDWVEGVVKKKPLHGYVDFQPGGRFTYISQQGYRGRDQFTYTIQYGSGRSKPARVLLNVVEPPR
jgi:hypothetical protein